jgi:hypothetical protein
LAIQQMKADPTYKGVEEALTNAQKALAVAPNNVALQEKLRRAQADANALMRKYGVESGGDSDLTAAPSAGAGAGAQVIRFDRSGNPIQ